MKGKSRYIAGLPEHYFGLLEQYYREHIVVFFEHKKGKHKLDYRFDLPHEKQDDYLSEKEVKSLIAHIEQNKKEQILKHTTFMQSTEETTDLLVIAKRHPDIEGLSSGVMLDIGNIADFRPELLAGQKEKTLGKMAAAVAHDIGNQMTIIYAMIERLEKKNTDKEALDTLLRATDTSKHILSQINDFSKEKIYKEIVDINHVVKSCMGLVCCSLKGDIILKHSFDAEHSTVFADVNMIRSAVLNIALNAVDAMPEGGVLKFETTNIIDGEGRECVQVAITDNGNGIDKNVLPNVFKMYYTTKKSGGTGIGLASVKKIAKENGGSVGIKSKKGKGTTVSVCLPLLSSDETVISSIRYAVIARRALVRMIVSNSIRRRYYAECKTFPGYDKAKSYYDDNSDYANIVVFDEKLGDGECDDICGDNTIKIGIDCNSRKEMMLKVLHKKLDEIFCVGDQ